MSMRTRVILVATSVSFVVWLTGIGGAAQDTPRTQETFRRALDLVTVDVSVLDGNRVPVRGLTMEDFTVLEDGHPQQITSFAAIDFPDVSPQGAAWLRDVPFDVARNDDLADRRIVVLVLDDATPMDPEDVPRLKKMARAVIDCLGPRDMAAVTFSADKKDTQDLTSDHARLLAAIDRFGGGITVDQAVKGSAGLTRQTMSGSDFDINAVSMYEATLETLRLAADDLGALPQRRKAVVFLSVGLPFDVNEAGPREGLSGGRDTALARRLFAVLQTVFEAAQRSNVNMYGVGPGLKASKDLTVKVDGTINRDVGEMNTDFLKTMSDATGGFAIVNTDDPGPGLAQLLRENGTYYLLGYEPTSTRTEGRFRRIEVHVRRPDVTVRARAGYYEAASARKPAAESSLQDALASFVPKADVAMQVAAAPFAIPGQRKAAVAVIAGLRQPVPSVTERTAENTAVLVSAYNESGERTAAERLQVSFTVRPGPADEIGYETFARLELPPGRYRLRLASQTTLLPRTGSVYCDVDVPDFANVPLSLSGIVIAAAPVPMAMGKDKLTSLLPVVPTAMRDFVRAGGTATAFLRVYQGGKGAPVDVPVIAQIVDGDGTRVLDASETLAGDRFSAGRAADYRLDLPLARLQTGPYLLTIEAALPGGARAKRDLRFVVH